MTTTLLTMKDVATELQISVWQAYELAKRPDFPALHIGRLVRVSRDGLAEWVESTSRDIQTHRNVVVGGRQHVH